MSEEIVHRESDPKQSLTHIDMLLEPYIRLQVASATHTNSESILGTQDGIEAGHQAVDKGVISTHSLSDIRGKAKNEDDMTRENDGQ